MSKGKLKAQIEDELRTLFVCPSTLTEYTKRCLSGPGEQFLSKLSAAQPSTAEAGEHFERDVHLSDPNLFGPHAPVVTPQRATEALLHALLLSTGRPAGFAHVLSLAGQQQDASARGFKSPLVRLLRRVAIWYYYHVMFDPLPQLVQLTSSCELLFQLMTPHQQLHCMSDIVLLLSCPALAEDIEQLDTPFHTATLLSMLKMAQQIAAAEGVLQEQQQHSKGQQPPPGKQQQQQEPADQQLPCKAIAMLAPPGQVLLRVARQAAPTICEYMLQAQAPGSYADLPHDYLLHCFTHFEPIIIEMGEQRVDKSFLCIGNQQSQVDAAQANMRTALGALLSQMGQLPAEQQRLWWSACNPDAPQFPDNPTVAVLAWLRRCCNGLDGCFAKLCDVAHGASGPDVLAVLMQSLLQALDQEQAPQQLIPQPPEQQQQQQRQQQREDHEQQHPAETLRHLVDVVLGALMFRHALQAHEWQLSEPWRLPQTALLMSIHSRIETLLLDAQKHLQPEACCTASSSGNGCNVQCSTRQPPAQQVPAWKVCLGQLRHEMILLLQLLKHWTEQNVFIGCRSVLENTYKQEFQPRPPLPQTSAELIAALAKLKQPQRQTPDQDILQFLQQHEALHPLAHGSNTGQWLEAVQQQRQQQQRLERIATAATAVTPATAHDGSAPQLARGFLLNQRPQPAAAATVARGSDRGSSSSSGPGRQAAAAAASPAAGQGQEVEHNVATYSSSSREQDLCRLEQLMLLAHQGVPAQELAKTYHRPGVASKDSLQLQIQALQLACHAYPWYLDCSPAQRAQALTFYRDTMKYEKAEVSHFEPVKRALHAMFPAMAEDLMACWISLPESGWQQLLQRQRQTRGPERPAPVAAPAAAAAAAAARHSVQHDDGDAASSCGDADDALSVLRLKGGRGGSSLGSGSGPASEVTSDDYMAFKDPEDDEEQQQQQSRSKDAGGAAGSESDAGSSDESELDIVPVAARRPAAAATSPRGGRAQSPEHAGTGSVATAAAVAGTSNSSQQQQQQQQQPAPAAALSSPRAADSSGSAAAATTALTPRRTRKLHALRPHSSPGSDPVASGRDQQQQQPQVPAWPPGLQSRPGAQAFAAAGATATSPAAAAGASDNGSADAINQFEQPFVFGRVPSPATAAAAGSGSSGTAGMRTSPSSGKGAAGMQANSARGSAAGAAAASPAATATTPAAAAAPAKAAAATASVQSSREPLLGNIYRDIEAVLARIAMEDPDYEQLLEVEQLAEAMQSGQEALLEQHFQTLSLRLNLMESMSAGEAAAAAAEAVGAGRHSPVWPAAAALGAAAQAGKDEVVPGTPSESELSCNACSSGAAAAAAEEHDGFFLDEFEYYDMYDMPTRFDEEPCPMDWDSSSPVAAPGQGSRSEQQRQLREQQQFDPFERLMQPMRNLPFREEEEPFERGLGQQASSWTQQQQQQQQQQQHLLSSRWQESQELLPMEEYEPLPGLGQHAQTADGDGAREAAAARRAWEQAAAMHNSAAAAGASGRINDNNGSSSSTAEAEGAEGAEAEELEGEEEAGEAARSPPGAAAAAAAHAQAAARIRQPQISQRQQYGLRRPRRVSLAEVQQFVPSRCPEHFQSLSQEDLAVWVNMVAVLECVEDRAAAGAREVMCAVLKLLNCDEDVDFHTHEHAVFLESHRPLDRDDNMVQLLVELLAAGPGGKLPSLGDRVASNNMLTALQADAHQAMFNVLDIAYKEAVRAADVGTRRVSEAAYVVKEDILRVWKDVDKSALHYSYLHLGPRGLQGLTTLTREWIQEVDRQLGRLEPVPIKLYEAQELKDRRLRYANYGAESWVRDFRTAMAGLRMLVRLEAWLGHIGRQMQADLRVVESLAEFASAAPSDHILAGLHGGLLEPALNSLTLGLTQATEAHRQLSNAFEDGLATKGLGVMQHAFNLMVELYNLKERDSGTGLHRDTHHDLIEVLVPLIGLIAQHLCSIEHNLPQLPPDFDRTKQEVLARALGDRHWQLMFSRLAQTKPAVAKLWWLIPQQTDPVDCIRWRAKGYKYPYIAPAFQRSRRLQAVQQQEQQQAGPCHLRQPANSKRPGQAALASGGSKGNGRYPAVSDGASSDEDGTGSDADSSASSRIRRSCLREDGTRYEDVLGRSWSVSKYCADCDDAVLPEAADCALALEGLHQGLQQLNDEQQMLELFESADPEQRKLMMLEYVETWRHKCRESQQHLKLQPASPMWQQQLDSEFYTLDLPSSSVDSGPESCSESASDDDWDADGFGPLRTPSFRDSSSSSGQKLTSYQWGQQRFWHPQRRRLLYTRQLTCNLVSKLHEGLWDLCREHAKLVAAASSAAQAAQTEHSQGQQQQQQERGGPLGMLKAALRWGSSPSEPTAAAAAGTISSTTTSSPQVLRIVPANIPDKQLPGGIAVLQRPLVLLQHMLLNVVECKKDDRQEHLGHVTTVELHTDLLLERAEGDRALLSIVREQGVGNEMVQRLVREYPSLKQGGEASMRQLLWSLLRQLKPTAASWYSHGAKHQHQQQADARPAQPPAAAAAGAAAGAGRKKAVASSSSSKSSVGGSSSRPETAAAASLAAVPESTSSWLWQVMAASITCDLILVPPALRDMMGSKWAAGAGRLAPSSSSSSGSSSDSNDSSGAGGRMLLRQYARAARRKFAEAYSPSGMVSQLLLLQLLADEQDQLAELHKDARGTLARALTAHTTAAAADALPLFYVARQNAEQNAAVKEQAVPDQVSTTAAAAAGPSSKRGASGSSRSKSGCFPNTYHLAAQALTFCDSPATTLPWLQLLSSYHALLANLQDQQAELKSDLDDAAAAGLNSATEPNPQLAAMATALLSYSVQLGPFWEKLQSKLQSKLQEGQDPELKKVNSPLVLSVVPTPDTPWLQQQWAGYHQQQQQWQQQGAAQQQQQQQQPLQHQVEGQQPPPQQQQPARSPGWVQDAVSACGYWLHAERLMDVPPQLWQQHLAHHLIHSSRSSRSSSSGGGGSSRPDANGTGASSTAAGQLSPQLAGMVADVTCDWCDGPLQQQQQAAAAAPASGAHKASTAGSGSSSGSSRWGCPSCRVAQYCSAPCATAAKKVHGPNCWRIQSLAANGLCWQQPAYQQPAGSSAPRAFFELR